MRDPYELKQPFAVLANIEVFPASSAGAERRFSLVNLLKNKNFLSKTKWQQYP